MSVGLGEVYVKGGGRAGVEGDGEVIVAGGGESIR